MGTFDPADKIRLMRDLRTDRYFRADSWREFNRRFFDRLASKYDATNAVHSFGMKRRMDRGVVRALPVRDGSAILDVCCGSGDIAVELARRFPRSPITGVDVSEPMLEIARRKARPFERVTYMTADALKLPFEDNTFDAAVISFGLRNLERPLDGIAEMKRVVKPGGAVCHIDQGKPSNPFFRMLYKTYFYRVAPLVGKLLFHRREFNSFRYLPESNRYFPSQAELTRIFERAGLEVTAKGEFFLGAVAWQILRV